MKDTFQFSVVEASVHGGSLAVLPFASKYPDVGPAEGSVAQSIAHGVYSAVNVAQVIEEIP